MQHINLSQVEWKEPVKGFKGRFVHSANMTFGYWDVEAGANLPEHSHPHEQVTNILEGEFELTVDGENHTARALYESVGFKVRSRTLWYEKKLR